jgi:hypothetical protein
MSDEPLPPDPKKSRERNERVPRRLRGVWRKLVLPADPPTRFVEPLDSARSTYSRTTSAPRLAALR